MWTTLRIINTIKYQFCNHNFYSNLHMKKTIILIFSTLFLSSALKAASYLHNEYSYLQDITFELYTDDIPAYKVPEQLKSIEETLMFDVLHATWIDKHWVAYTLNKDLLGTYKVGQPALLDNGSSKKIFFIATFPGTIGGLDLYTAEYKNGIWSNPKNLGNIVNTTNNESNPGLLNDNTLTYSSGGIIKKLDLKTFKVVDLEEVTSKPQIIKNDKDVLAAIGDNSTASPTGNVIDNNVGAIGDNSTAAPVNTEQGKAIMQSKTMAKEDQLAVVKKEKSETEQVAKSVQSNSKTLSENISSPVKSMAVQDENVQMLGAQSRDAMLAKYKTAIQLGAFTSPKWDLIKPLSKYGKLVSYKNENGTNVVWLTGFANHAAAESVLPQVKATVGFENAYITGK